MLSYSQLHIQNTAFAAFAPHLRARAKIPQLLSASPLNMGLFSPTPPAWHPAPPALRTAIDETQALLGKKAWKGGLVDVAMGYAYNRAEAVGIPTVVGMSNLREVHENVSVWRAVTDGKGEREREDCEKEVGGLFAGMKNWAWASPPPGV